VFSWLAALTSCWNIFLSFMGSIPALTGERVTPTQFLKAKSNTSEATWERCRLSCLDLSHQPPEKGNL
jgi:hypothetical protein